MGWEEEEEENGSKNWHFIFVKPSLNIYGFSSQEEVYASEHKEVAEADLLVGSIALAAVTATNQRVNRLLYDQTWYLSKNLRDRSFRSKNFTQKARK